MPLETAQFITQLNAANPALNDEVEKGDDHLRMIKSVLLNSFPAVSAPVTATPAELNMLVGTTGSVQSQLDVKAPIVHTHSESEITDEAILARVASNETITGTWTFEQRLTTNQGLLSLGPVDVFVSSGTARIRFGSQADGAQDKFWELGAGSGIAYLSMLADNLTGLANVFTFSRSSGALTGIAYGNTINNPTHTFYGNVTFSLNATVQGNLVVAGTLTVASLAVGGVSNAELAMLDGVTAPIQGQLDGKAAASHTHAASDITSGTFANARVAASNVTQHQAALSLDASQTASSVLTNSGTAITVASNMREAVVQCTGASAITITINDSHGFSTGQSVAFMRKTTSTVTFVGGGSQSIFATGNRMSIPEQNGVAVATYLGPSSWQIGGV